MERIKKIFIISAMTFTAAVTSLFLYMPFKNMLREMGKDQVSIEQEGEVIQIDASDQPEASEKAERYEAEIEGNYSDTVLSVSADGEKGHIRLWNNEEGQYYFFMPALAMSDTNEIQLDQCEGGGYAVIAGRRINEGDSIRDIVWDEEYTLQIYDRKDALQIDTTVIFMCAENLPAVYLETESGSMDTIHASKENCETGSLIIFDAEGNLVCKGELEEIKGRGNSTWIPMKKPYHLKLRNSTDLFGFGKAKKWNLLANCYDETGIRNLLAGDLANALELAYTPEGRMVSLYCNGEYKGSYYLCEQVQVGEERVNIRDMEDEMQSVYQNIQRDKLKQAESEDGKRRWVEMEYNPQDISGGYLLERKLASRYESETISGFQTTQGDYYEIASPEYATAEQVTYIADLMQEIHDAIEESDGIHPGTGKHYSEYIDVDSFARKYLLEEICKNYDGGVMSSFFYKPADEESSRIFAGPVWDYDIAFGNSVMDAINSNPKGVTKLADHTYATSLFAKLYDQEDFKKLVMEYYQQKAVPWIQFMTEEKLQEYEVIYRQSSLMNQIRWAGMTNRAEYYESYENNMRYLKYFLNERMNFLSDVWIEGETYHCITLMSDGLPWKKIYVKDGECAGVMPVPVRNNSIFIGFFKEENDISYDEYRPVYEDMVFDAWWQEVVALEE